MKNILQNWKGGVQVNGKDYEDIAQVDFKGLKGSFRILLTPNNTKPVIERHTASHTHIQDTEKTGEVRVFVKSYMTKPAEPSFDFMEKWNNNKPMPLREMVGVRVKETRGMVYMKLHGMAKPVITCMRCGKTLTNPISRKYGIGPECMSKLGFMFAIDDVENIKEALVNVEWEGWIIKSAILEEEAI